MAETKVPNWMYNLIGISSNRRAARTATPQNYAAQLIGFDGNHEGGLRPIGGFQKVVTFDYGYSDDAGLASNGGYQAGGTLKGIQWITFRIGDKTYAYGAVYRVLNKAGTKVAYRLVFRIGTETTWRTDYVDLGLNSLITPEAYAGEQFHVEPFGRFVYVFRSGLRPFMFYIEPSGGGYATTVVTDPGPGVAPLLTNPVKNSAAAKVIADGTRTANQDVTEVLTTMTVPTGVDASARVVYFGFSNLHRCSTDGLNNRQNPHLDVRNRSAIGGVTDDPLLGPSDLGLWASPPQPNPSFADVEYLISGLRQPYIYAAIGSYSNDRSGWGYYYNGIDKTPMGLSAFRTGDFIWAYRLYDSRTGRISKLSNRLTSTQDNYGFSAVKETKVSSPTGLNSLLDPVTFPMMQVIYDKRKYDTLIVYRGIAQAGLSTQDVVLSEENTITLSDYHIDTQPGDTNWKIAAYFMTISDEDLVTRPVFSGNDNYLEQMPYAGSARAYEGSFLLGKMGQLEDNIGGLGKAIWSSLVEVTPELCSASDRYLLGQPDEEIDRFCKLGPNVVGFSRISPYLFRREINYMKAQPMQYGYGIPNARAACECGSDVYYISESGLHRIGSDGSLQDISAVNQIIQQEWAADLESVQMAFDTPTATIILLNPVKEKAVIIWLRTTRVTELSDVSFSHLTSGSIPFSPATATRLQERAIFVQNVQYDASTFGWRIFVLDYARQKGSITLMDPTGEVNFKALATKGIGTNTVSITGTIGTRVENCYLYVTSGDYAGSKIKILFKVSDAIFQVEPLNIKITAGDQLSLSPVYCEWVGALLGLRDENGNSIQGQDFYAVRSADSMSAIFSDVVPPTDTSLAKFQGVLYRGSESSPIVKEYARTLSGAVTPNVYDGVSSDAVGFKDPAVADTAPRWGIHANALFPAVRIFTAGMDFQLLAVTLDGTIRDPNSIRGATP